ncbi:MAG: RES family NAD+ phosphorylase [Arenicellales bacterium]
MDNSKTYRLVKKKYTSKPLDGLGGLHVDGRWHSKGKPIIYSSQSIALAKMEILTRLGGERPLMKAYSVFEIVFDEAETCRLEQSDLPDEWDSWPYGEATQMIGDNWIDEGKYLAMSVPSATEPRERNILINPLHPKIRTVKAIDIGPAMFDDRLFQKKKN